MDSIDTRALQTHVVYNVQLIIFHMILVLF